MIAEARFFDFFESDLALLVGAASVAAGPSSVPVVTSGETGAPPPVAADSAPLRAHEIVLKANTDTNANVTIRFITDS